jgi:hypothetical protein
MKTLFSIIGVILFLSISLNLSAQFGVRAGVNFANLSFEPEDDEFASGKRMGLGLGVFYKVAIGEKLFIQPELNFMQHGTRFDVENFGQKINSSVLFNYLQLPMMAKYGFGDMDAMNFYIQAGPYIGLGMGKVMFKTCIDGKCETQDIKYDGETEGFKNPDFGLQLGAGVNLDAHVSLDVRYILGLQNLTSAENSTIKHTGINLSFGYTF